MNRFSRVLGRTASPCVLDLVRKLAEYCMAGEVITLKIECTICNRDLR